LQILKRLRKLTGVLQLGEESFRKAILARCAVPYANRAGRSNGFGRIDPTLRPDAGDPLHISALTAGGMRRLCALL
jgi:hypothetical protein